MKLFSTSILCILVTLIASAEKIQTPILRPYYDSTVIYPDMSEKESNTYVFVHGAWSNSLLFKEIDSVLAAQGNTIYRPTLTGLGERKHLANFSINLTTHINDIVNTIRVENLHDVILVGHSYGGMVISGVAEQVPDRIRKLVYIDAFLPNDGESVLTSGSVSKSSRTSLKSNIKGKFVIMPIKSIKTTERQPLNTFTERIKLTAISNGKLPGVYVLMVPPGIKRENADFYGAVKRATERGWKVLYEEGNHADLIAKPIRLATLLNQIKESK